MNIGIYPVKKSLDMIGPYSIWAIEIGTKATDISMDFTHENLVS